MRDGVEQFKGDTGNELPGWLAQVVSMPPRRYRLLKISSRRALTPSPSCRSPVEARWNRCQESRYRGIVVISSRGFQYPERRFRHRSLRQRSAHGEPDEGASGNREVGGVWATVRRHCWPDVQVADGMDRWRRRVPEGQLPEMSQATERLETYDDANTIPNSRKMTAYPDITGFSARRCRHRWRGSPDRRRRSGQRKASSWARAITSVAGEYIKNVDEYPVHRPGIRPLPVMP